MLNFNNYIYEKEINKIQESWEAIAPGDWLLLDKCEDSLRILKSLLESLGYNSYLDIESYDEKICGIRKRGKFLIPKIIHAVWIGDKSLPVDSVRYLKSWSEKHDGWGRWIWSDRGLSVEGWESKDINELDMSLKDLYLKFTKQARRSNIARLEIIKKYGGVYIDCDIICQKNIEYLIDGLDSFGHKYFGHKYGKYEESINNAFFGSTKENKFIDLNLLMIKNKENNYKNLDNEPFGPIIMTEVKKIHDIYSFEPWVAAPYNWLEKEKSRLNYPEAFCIHKWDKNW